MNSRASASAGVSAMLVGGQRNCCKPKNGGGIVSITLNSRDPAHRSHRPESSRCSAGGDPVDLVESVVAVLLVPQVAGARVDGHAEAVADAVGEDLLDVRADLAADAAAELEERIVARASCRRR